jgi:DNA repair protein RadC
LCLNTKNKVAGAHIISQGSLSASIVHPREVFKAALLNNSASIILAHNHPSGDPEPSREDVETTKRLVEAGEILGIRVLDHVIIGEQYLSMKEEGLM